MLAPLPRPGNADLSAAATTAPLTTGGNRIAGAPGQPGEREMADQEEPQVARRARELLELSGNCAQSSFAALAEHLRFDPGSTLKALTPFPGIALRGETCGAVTGSLMAIGMVLGRDRLDDGPGMQPSVKAARRFCRAFDEEFGGTPCRVVLERGLGGTFDLTRPEEVAAYVAAGGPGLCSRLVGRSVVLAAEAIEHAADSGRAS